MLLATRPPVAARLAQQRCFTGRSLLPARFQDFLNSE
jgi:hypothetical protein